MHASIEFVLHYGYAVLAVWVFAEQVGIPVPAMPILLATGALAGEGRMSLAASLLISVLAALAADGLWFQLGRSRGSQTLRLLCKLSLEPDSCVRSAEGVFSSQGAVTLIYSKFVPGLSTIAPPLAGVVGLPPWRFALFDALGALVWSGTFLGLGFAFAGEIERLAESAEAAGGWALTVLVGAVAAYVAYKFFARRRFLRELRIARIGVDELKARIDAGESLVIVDLRHPLAVRAEPATIPGALRMDADELRRGDRALPRDREVMLFCT
jgi:membrane protein DedA with SNARE-associated domain